MIVDLPRHRGVICHRGTTGLCAASTNSGRRASKLIQPASPWLAMKQSSEADAGVPPPKSSSILFVLPLQPSIEHTTRARPQTSQLEVQYLDIATRLKTPFCKTVNLQLLPMLGPRKVNEGTRYSWSTASGLSAPTSTTPHGRLVRPRFLGRVAAMDRTVTVEHYKVAMLLSGAGDALGYRNQQWEYNESGAAIHKELEELGGLKNIKAELPDWPVSDDTVLHLATAEGLATGKEGEDLLHEVAARYVEGMKDMEGRKPGPSSIHGVSQLRPGEEGGYRVAYNPEGTGCGAAMRSMCIGLSEMDQSQHNDTSASLGAESERDTRRPEDPEDAEETGDAKAIGELKGYLHNCEKFYIFSKFLKSEGEGKKKVHTGSAKCMQPGCKNKGVTYTSISRAHLRAHYQTVHPGKKSALTAALAGNSKRGQRTKHPSKKRRLPAEESCGETFSQEQARQMFTRWFVETLSPPSLCEHPYTKELFAYLNPEFQLMSRRTLARDLDELMEKAKLEVNHLLSKQQWLATTADSWTVHNRAFLGMTVHWIDRLSLKRKKATLACRELKVGQTHQLLGEAIHDVHREFGIVEKVVATTTDNGANYVAASNAFGESEERGEVQEEEEEEEEEEVTGQPADVQGQLNDEDIDAEPEITLPPHRCCSVHTLNLMATTDIREVKGWSKGDTPWRRASAKARRLWNLQNRSPTAAGQIKEAVKRKLTTPVAVRWNSYLNSVKVLLEVMSLPEQAEAINNIIIHHNAGVAIQDQDIKVLTEYRDVMNPVADTLDSLQGEDNAYMGILLPTLLVLKRWLLQHQQRGELQYAEPLVQALLRGFDKRFGFLFEDQDLLMACALHPSFTPAVLTRIVSGQADAIKGRILRELQVMVRPGEEQQQEQRPIQAQSDVKSHQDMVFNELFGTDQEVMSQDVDRVLMASMQDWKPRREALSWALFPKEHREAWVDLFIKYNTPLPSSAAVERMFCIAGDILRRKRAALASHNFQKLVFLKGNMCLLGYPSYQGQFGGEKSKKKL